MRAEPSPGPLSHLNVLDLSRVRAGPTCVRQLSDWGAEVIQIEMPDRGQGEGFGGPRDAADYINLHRNKRSLVLDLKTPQGLAVLSRLIGRADILVENFRPGVTRRLGIDYETTRRINPRLVYASISGFGQTGPYSQRPGFDPIAQGMGGLMSVTGMPGNGPLRVGISIADLSAGFFCALGILVALLERERSGLGQWVQTSLLQSQIFLLDYQAVRWLIDGELPRRTGNDHPTSTPTGTFRTSDGHINIAVVGQQIWERFCNAIGALDLAANSSYTTNAGRTRHRAAIDTVVQRILSTRTSKEWIDLLNDAGIPCGPIYAVDEMFEDPQVRHLEVTKPLTTRRRGTVAVLAQPVLLSRTPGSIRRPPPEPGEHTNAILGELGYSPEDIRLLRQNGVIGRPRPDEPLEEAKEGAT